MNRRSGIAKAARGALLSVVIGSLASLLALLPLVQSRAVVVEAAPSSQAGVVLAELCTASSVVGPEVCVAAGATFMVWYCYQYGCSDIGVISEAATQFWDWFDGLTGGDPVLDDFVDQYGNHSDHFVISQAMLDAWFDALPAFIEGGWDYQLAPGGLDRPSYHRRLGSSTIGETLTMRLKVPATLGGAGVRDVSARLDKVDMPRVPSGASPAYVRILDTGGEPLPAGGSSGYFGNSITGLWLNQDNPASFFDDVDHLRTEILGGAGFYIQLEWTQQFGKDVYIPAIGAMTVTTGYTDNEIPETVLTLGALDFLAEIEVTSVVPDGSTVFVPENIDDLLCPGSSPNCAIPLVVGGTAPPLVIPNEGEGVDTGNVGWWEGLFDRVTGAVRDVGGILSDILTAVQALPTVIADLFNPTLAWANFTDTQYPAARDAIGATAPGCYAGMFGEVTLFGNGDDNDFLVDVGLPGNTINVRMPFSNEVAAITYPLSTLATMITVFMWMLGKLRNPLLEAEAT